MTYIKECLWKLNYKKLVKSLMTNIYLVKRIFKACGYTPNRTLISKIFKDLSCLQRIAA